MRFTKFIKSQENQLLLAIVQQGNFSFKNEHKHFEVSLDKWSRWTPEQYQRHISIMLAVSVILQSSKPTPRMALLNTVVEDASIREMVPVSSSALTWTR
jgi:hypothetical protein